jgi:hypothetical protein
MTGRRLIVIGLAPLAVFFAGCPSPQSGPDAGFVAGDAQEAALDAANSPTDAGDSDASPAQDAGASDDAGSIECQPACLPDQRCDATRRPPACIELCNYPIGCRPDEDNPFAADTLKFEVCNHETSLCEPVTCNGVQCQFGQTCLNLQTASYDSSAECTCFPDFTGPYGEFFVDTCAYYSQICTIDFRRLEPASCRLPRIGEPCGPQLEGPECDQEGTDGTNAGMECVDGLCWQWCEESSACRDPKSKCTVKSSQMEQGTHAKHCQTNYCLDPSGVEIPDVPTDRNGYFAACSSSTDDDGTCWPEPAWFGVIADIGICAQNGLVAENGECDPDARRPHLDEMCGPSLYCQKADPIGASGYL